MVNTISHGQGATGIMLSAKMTQITVSNFVIETALTFTANLKDVCVYCGSLAERQNALRSSLCARRSGPVFRLTGLCRSSFDRGALDQDFPPTPMTRGDPRMETI